MLWHFISVTINGMWAFISFPGGIGVFFLLIIKYCIELLFQGGLFEWAQGVNIIGINYIEQNTGLLILIYFYNLLRTCIYF